MHLQTDTSLMLHNEATKARAFRPNTIRVLRLNGAPLPDMRPRASSGGGGAGDRFSPIPNSRSSEEGEMAIKSFQGIKF